MMVLTISSLILAVVTAANSGESSVAWLGAHTIAAATAIILPVGLSMTPVVRQRVDLLVAPPE